MLGHTHEHIFLILLWLLRGVEESIEDSLEGLYLIDWSSFLVLALNSQLILKLGSVKIHTLHKRRVSFHYKRGIKTWSFDIISDCSSSLLIVSILFLSLLLYLVLRVLLLVLIINACIFTKVLGVLDLLGQFLNGLCDFCLEPAFKEHCERDEDQHSVS